MNGIPVSPGSTPETEPRSHRERQRGVSVSGSAMGGWAVVLGAEEGTGPGQPVPGAHSGTTPRCPPPEPRCLPDTRWAPTTAYGQDREEEVEPREHVVEKREGTPLPGDGRGPETPSGPGGCPRAGGAPLGPGSGQRRGRAAAASLGSALFCRGRQKPRFCPMGSARRLLSRLQMPPLSWKQVVHLIKTAFHVPGGCPLCHVPPHYSQSLCLCERKHEPRFSQTRYSDFSVCGTPHAGHRAVGGRPLCALRREQPPARGKPE